MRRQWQIWRGALALALAAGFGGVAWGQEPAIDYRLPPAPASPRVRSQGPVDPDNPIVVPRATPTPAPSPPPSPDVPQAAPRLTPFASPAPGRVRPPSRRSETPAPVASRQAEVTAIPGKPQPAASADIPSAPATQAAPPIAAPSPPPISAAPARLPLPWLLGGGLLALAAIGALVWRRRSPPPSEQAAQSESNEPAEPARTTVETPPPAQPVVADTESLVLRFEPEKLILSLVYATLSYRLTVTNVGEGPAGPLRLAADLISAHASLGARHQLLLETRDTESQHDLGLLAPGQTIALAGELRLALADILPIRSDRGYLFIPLVRFRIEPRAPGGEVITRAFAVGQSGAEPGDALRPLNLDLGPRTIRDLDQRVLTVPG